MSRTKTSCKVPFSVVLLKHIKNFSIKNFGPPERPPPSPKNLYVWAFFLCFEEKGGPKDKEFTGSWVFWKGGGVGGGFLAKFFIFMHAFVRGRDVPRFGSGRPGIRKILCKKTLG